MPGISETLATLARYRRSMAPRAAGTVLTESAGWGADPGNLRMFTHVPPGLAKGGALVVVLHGCTQTAATYDAASGWSTLASRFGFALLLPQQKRENNASGCFNWFLPEDIGRGMGEAASMRAMIQHLVVERRLDPRRIFVSGLSAGGAFANVMLAAYPDVFAGGAVVAGLPYGGARDLATAIAMMSKGQSRSNREWGDLVRAGSTHRGPWPYVQIWHGGQDGTVAPVNATDVARQWCDVHGIDPARGRRDRLGPADRVDWGPVVSYTLPRLGHAVPIDTSDRDPAWRCGTVGPFATEAGIGSSVVSAQSWGLIPR